MMDIDIRFIKQFLDFVHEAKMSKIDLLVTCTYRSWIEQETLYAQGRTTKGLIITNAKGGESPHNCTRNNKPAALALDVVPLVLGKPNWSTDGRSLDVWHEIGDIAINHNLEWGGLWQGAKKDLPHFQIKNWKIENVS